jgi:hypothetical protein
MTVRDRRASPLVEWRSAVPARSGTRWFYSTARMAHCNLNARIASADRSSGTQRDASEPLTLSEHGLHGRRRTLDGQRYALPPHLGSGSTPLRLTVGKRSTPGDGESPGANGNSPATPNDRSRYGPKEAKRSEYGTGNGSVSGASPTPKLLAARDSGMRLGGTPANATPTCGRSPSGTFVAYWIASMGGAFTVTSPSPRLSTTSSPSPEKVGTPSGISSGRASRATQRRGLGYWSSIATAVAVGASLSDREGAAPLRCRVAPSRPTNMEVCPC